MIGSSPTGSEDVSLDSEEDDEVSEDELEVDEGSSLVDEDVSEMTLDAVVEELDVISSDDGSLVVIKDEVEVTSLVEVIVEVVNDAVEGDDGSDESISEDRDELAHEDIAKTIVVNPAIRNLLMSMDNTPRPFIGSYLRTLLFSAITSISISGSVNPA